MSQYRILQTSKNRFKPQAKGWFFWHDFGNLYITRTFNTHEEADEFLQRYMEEHDLQKYPKVVASWG